MSPEHAERIAAALERIARALEQPEAEAPAKKRQRRGTRNVPKPTIEPTDIDRARAARVLRQHGVT